MLREVVDGAPEAVSGLSEVLTGVEMAEPAPCVEQDLEHMVDDTFHANPR